MGRLGVDGRKKGKEIQSATQRLVRSKHEGTIRGVQGPLKTLRGQLQGRDWFGVEGRRTQRVRRH